MRPVLLVLLLVTLAASQELDPDGPARHGKIAVIRLRDEAEEQIDTALQASVLRRIAEAREWGATCVVFDIRSYGGLVTASIDTGDEIFALGEGVHTVAYVDRRAISGAAMLSVACREIVMSAAGSIGDSQAITMEGAAPEKIQTVVATTFRKYAARNGVPVALVEAMVRPEIEVVRFRKPVDKLRPHLGTTWAYYRGDDLPGIDVLERDRLEDPETIVPRDELATFTAEEAVEYGVATRIVPDLDTLLTQLGTPGGSVRTYDWTWAERTSRFLLSIRMLLFLLGVGGLYFSLKIPGTGVPEVITLLGFGLFFGASAISGFAGSLEVVLFLVGVALLAVEIFVLPGFGVSGFLGLGFVLASLALAALPEFETREAPSFYLIPLARDFLVACFAAIVGVMLLARHLPRLPMFSGYTLVPSPAATAKPAPSGPAVGDHGTAETQLRPSGRARFRDGGHDVVAEGRFVAPGTRVRVVAVQGSRILVRPEDAPA